MKVTVVGGSGYAGGEIIRLLLRHKDVEDITTTSRTPGKKVSEIHQNLKGIYDKEFNLFDEENEDSDVVFLAIPHGDSMKVAPKLLAKGIKVIDIGADYRMKDVKLYQKVYGLIHESPQWLEKAVYGLPELNRKEISKAKLVANPGCFVTAALLSLLPMKDFRNRIDLGKIVVDADTGTSGAGNTPTEFTHHSEVDGNLKPYKVTGHRHQYEIEHVINRTVQGAKISFTPTLAPIARGILSRTHMFGNFDTVNLKAHYQGFYEKEPFVRITDLPCVKNVACTNYCDIGVHFDKEKQRVLVISAIDNLGKGAAGQAVQNMNIMFGIREDEGLRVIPAHP